MLELRRYCPRTDLKRGFSARTCGRTDLTQSVQVFTGRRRLRLASFRRTNPIRPTSTLIPGSPATFSVTQSIEKKKRNEATTLAQRLCPPTKTAAALTAAAFANSNGSLRTTSISRGPCHGSPAPWSALPARRPSRPPERSPSAQQRANSPPSTAAPPPPSAATRQTNDAIPSSRSSFSVSSTQLHSSPTDSRRRRRKPIPWQRPRGRILWNFSTFCPSVR